MMADIGSQTCPHPRRGAAGFFVLSSRHAFIILGLQIYASLLAAWHLPGGVQTDEAKYLLNIPYPHPPLGRFLFHLTESWAVQEVFWRVMLATLLVQAVFLVWSMGKSLPARDRWMLCGVWLLSASFVAQAGAIMMVSLVTLQELVLVWLTVRRDIDVTRFGGWLAIFWGMMLFTALQSLLLLPLVITLFTRSRLPRWFQAFSIISPLLLLALFTLGQPLLAASLLLVQGDHAGLSLGGKFKSLLWILGRAGSVWGSVLGVVGMLSRRPGALFWTLFLFSAYTLVSAHAYYSLLFLPLLLGGLVVLLRRFPLPPTIVLLPVLIGTLLLWPQLRPAQTPDPARIVSAGIAARHLTGSLLIAGPFGHQWQYESSLPVRRYRPEFLNDAQAVVCLAQCPEISRSQEHPFSGAGQWMPMRGVAIEVWVRR